MSVFKMIKDKRSAHAGKKLVNELTKGQKYICYDFKQRQSDYLDKVKKTYPMNLIAYMKDPRTNNNYYVTCPALYNDLPENQFQELKESVAKSHPPFLVYYGKDGNRNELIIHEHSDEIDQDLLQRYLKVEEEETLDDPPLKRMRSSTSSSGDDSFGNTSK